MEKWRGLVREETRWTKVDVKVDWLRMKDIRGMNGSGGRKRGEGLRWTKCFDKRRGKEEVCATQVVGEW